MSTPVIESIALALADIVNAITTANGYNYTLNAERPTTLTLTEDLIKDKNVIISQGDPSEDEPCDYDRTWMQPFYLTAIVYEESGTAIDTKINQIRSDIEKAIAIENVNHVKGKRLDGLADYLNINAPIHLDFDQCTGIVVPVTVTYTVTIDDPYSVA